AAVAAAAAAVLTPRSALAGLALDVSDTKDKDMTEVVAEVLLAVPFPAPAQDAFLIRQSLEFQQTRAPILRAEAEAVQVPRHTYTCARRIWQPKNWVKRRGHNNNWELRSKSEDFQVHTGVWFWRVWWFFVTIFCNISDALLFAYESMFED